MKTYCCMLILIGLVLITGCTSTTETMSENVAAESADLQPPNMESIETNPIIVHREEAYYPEMAQKSGTDGTVVLRAWITKTGIVRKVQIHKADTDMFNASALSAGLKYRFAPVTKDGNAVDSWVEFAIQYHLRK